MSHAADITVFSRDPDAGSWLQGGGSVRVTRRAEPDLVQKGPAFLVLARASGLMSVADFVSKANHDHRLRGLLVNLDMDAAWITQMLDRAGLRTLRNCLLHTGPAVPQRVVEAWRCGAQDELIADVAVTDTTVFVMTCAFQRLEVDVAAVPALKLLTSVQLRDFQVAPDGNYVYWPAADVHLDADAFRVAADPGYRENARIEQMKRLADFGSRVRQLRKKQGLAASQVPGVSERQMRRIELGEFFPRVDTLSKLAAAHQLELDRYLAVLAEA